MCGWESSTCKALLTLSNAGECKHSRTGGAEGLNIWMMKVNARWAGRVGIPSKSFFTYHSWFSRSGIQQYTRAVETCIGDEFKRSYEVIGTKQIWLSYPNQDCQLGTCGTPKALHQMGVDGSPALSYFWPNFLWYGHWNSLMWSYFWLSHSFLSALGENSGG